MSLKLFHVVFVALATLLGLGLAAWAARHGRPALAVAAAGGTALLAAYGVRFARRLRGSDGP